MENGYFRYPAVFGDQIVFVSEDDLWTVPLKGGLAVRLTSGLGTISRPSFSKDGQWIAFSSEEEGHREVALISSVGGESSRLTYLGQTSDVVGWTHDGEVLFATNALSSQRTHSLCTVNPGSKQVNNFELGPLTRGDFSEKGELVVERSMSFAEPAYWKRYRGGTAGRLWYSENLEADFRPLIDLSSNLNRPQFVGERIYFVSDHEGVGNIYSCNNAGKELERHTNHKDFYVRNPQNDGKTMVYHCGGKIFALDLKSNQVSQVEIQYNSQRTQGRRKFVSATKYLEAFDLDKKGDRIALTTRGQVHAMRNWEGPSQTVAAIDGVRFRLGAWSNCDQKIIAVSDDGGEERLEVFDLSANHREVLDKVEIGRVRKLEVAPYGDYVALSNHKCELIIVNLKTKECRSVHQNKAGEMDSFAWSPDANLLAFVEHDEENKKRICIYNIKDNLSRPVTQPLLNDSALCFDPKGLYLYFSSNRVLTPTYDSVQFELSFVQSAVPCCLPLLKSTLSPFVGRSISSFGEEDKEDHKDSSKENNKKEEKKAAVSNTPNEVKVDYDGIENRIIAFPVPGGDYRGLQALEGKLLWVKWPFDNNFNWRLPPQPKGELQCYDFDTQKVETLVSGMNKIAISKSGKKLAYTVGKKIRVINAGEKAESSKDTDFSKKAGWIDLSRIRPLIQPRAEWRQMLKEVWRLQRDHFWVTDMSKVDWQGVMDKYLPLVDLVNSRSEFGDLVWEVQGELGTSHAYDMGGDYRPNPAYSIGFLGADFRYDKAISGYCVDKIFRGDSWSASASPIFTPGVNWSIEEDVLVGINGTVLDENLSPSQVLMNKAGVEVELTIRRKNEERKVVVKTIESDKDARYRDWVEGNRKYVYEKSSGRTGYIHIPDMGTNGFAEFHRGFLQEYNRDSLIVDVRYNAGGHVSQLLLEKLSRKRLGIMKSRWFGESGTPDQSPAGPIVALTNENAGSDGDIFSHTFKMKGFGPLIGKRTWGGVVGIWPRHSLVDGGMTTQPEFAHWYKDVGWDVENYGTDPNIDLDNEPHHFRRGEDPQLDRGLEEVLKLLQEKPPFRPQVKTYPSRSPEIQI